MLICCAAMYINKSDVSEAATQEDNKRMQIPSIHCVGLTHRTAPVALRELVSNPPRPWDEYLSEILPSNSEWCVLSTCNRFEIYVAIPAATTQVAITDSLLLSNDSRPELQTPKDPAIAALIALLATVTETELNDLWMHLYYVCQEAAAEHLCCVASGLESLVFGEPQILGQVSDMFMSATKRKSVGPALNILLRAAIRAGKRARCETAIGQNAMGVSAVALKMAESMVTDLSQRRITVIGLGEMGQLTIRGLRDRRIPNVNVVNRSVERAEAVATSMGADSGWRAHPIQQLSQVLAESDVIFAATGATDPVITAPMMDYVRDFRHAQPAAVKQEQKLLLFDMAVPRDICPEVGNCTHVHLTDIDQLQSHAADALRARKAAIPEVYKIIEQELSTYEFELTGLRMRPLVVDLRLNAEKVRQRELERTLGFIGDAEPEVIDHLYHFSKSLTNKLLHEPTIYIKEMAHAQSVDEFELMVRNLFDLRLDLDGNVDTKQVDENQF